MIEWYWMVLIAMATGVIGYCLGVWRIFVSDHPAVLTSNEWNDVILNDRDSIKKALHNIRN
ncbi:MAG: hypothetical protein JJ958_06680 [Balneola sp.]|nr:hypothetical protein [Balneola sp.]